jgi:uncharacterized protein YcbX
MTIMENETLQVVGRVEGIRRYPVKSMAGEELLECAATEKGLAGDRAFALVEEGSGKVVCAKNPRKWDGVLNYRAEFTAGRGANKDSRTVRIAFPDGDATRSDDESVDAVLSEKLGHRVHLASTPPEGATLESTDAEAPADSQETHDWMMPPGTFFDLAPVHLVTTASLSHLQTLLPQSKIDVRRFRPNLVVETAEELQGFVENDWVGRTLAIGDEVVLRILCPCPRCIMTTVRQGGLPKDPEVLRSAVAHNQGSIGVYAAVERAGKIRVGDAVKLSAE